MINRLILFIALTFSVGFAHADVSALENLMRQKNRLEISDFLTNNQPNNKNEEIYFIYLKLFSIKENNSDRFLSYFENSIVVIENEQHKLLPDFYILVSNYYKNKEDYSNYLIYLNKAKNYYVENDKYSKLISVYLELSKYYFNNEQYHLSLSFLNQIAVLPEKITDHPTTFGIYFLYGDIYFNLLAYEDANNYYLKAYEFQDDNSFKNISNKSKAELLYKLSLSHIKIKKITEANNYIEEGITLSKRSNILLFKFYLLKSHIYYTNSLFIEAKRMIDYAENILSSDFNSEFFFYKFYTYYYEDKNANVKILENIVNELMLKSSDEDKNEEYFYVLYLYYSSINNNKEALYYFEKYHDFYKNFFENDLQKNISELRHSMENEIKENNLKISLKEAKTNKLLFEKNEKIKEQQTIIIFVGAGVIIFVIILLVRNIIIKHKLKRYSEIDDLTKVYNRRFISKMAHKLHNDKNNYSLIIFDLDYFKKINDDYGHQTGDEVLIKVCETTKGFLRNTDYLGRYGGEEFIIFLPDTEIKNAVEISERIRLEIEQLIFEGTEELKATASFGVNNFNSSLTINDVFEIADKRLYKAKNNGRNQVIYED